MLLSTVVSDQFPSYPTQSSQFHSILNQESHNSPTLFSSSISTSSSSATTAATGCNSASLLWSSIAQFHPVSSLFARNCSTIDSRQSIVGLDQPDQSANQLPTMPSCFETIPSHYHGHSSLHPHHPGHHPHHGLMSTGADSNPLATSSLSPSPPTLPALTSLSSSSSSSSSHPTGHSLHYPPNGRAIRYYQPLMEPYSALNYNSLNQKRESVITFSSNVISKGSAYLDNLDDLDDEDDKSRLVVSDLNNSTNNKGSPSQSPSHSQHHNLHNQHQKFKANQVLIDGTPFTLDQIVCICQVLQKCDLHKLEKFIYSLPVDNKLSKNELILRARAIASYHSNNYKAVYEILENNHFNVKYHQELQNLWNNAHYKEHEMKRGHPPGAVEKYRIRKKFQFPLTIWDGEEYVYCFKEKNRRILKEFYQKCNLPTQEDKLKLSNQTQLTVVQISNWFKNRRQRDRQPNHEPDNKTSSDAHSNLTNESPRPNTPATPHSLPLAGGGNRPPSFPSLAIAQQSQHHNSHLHLNQPHHREEPQQVNNMLGPETNNNSHQMTTNTSTGNFCQILNHHSQAPGTHRSYYFLPQ